MLTMTLFALIWLFLYTSLYVVCGPRLTNLLSRLTKRFSGLLGSFTIAALAMVGSWFIFSLFLVDPPLIKSPNADFQPKSPPAEPRILRLDAPLDVVMSWLKGFFMGTLTSFVATLAANHLYRSFYGPTGDPRR